ncbi:hypothetical protein [Nonomuraea sp. NPDC049480]|uniref:hypothetical protein n=1 Tax=Nonomuraea sp. NPDC049480 TaxID=3364353 RepID=UPI0037B20E7D
MLQGSDRIGRHAAHDDLLKHALRGDMCALRVIKDGIISVPVMIPADPDRDPDLFREALKRLEAVTERMSR